jgi:hypothetical protein
MVYVLNINGQPLMPTNRHGKVKHLLKQGKAKVVKKCPFTIKLLYDSTISVQELTLGVDTGSGTIGAAVSNNKNKIVYTSKIILRNDITKKESNTEYYDLYDKYGNLMCMDGETYKVIEEDDRYKLINTDGEYDTEFYLTKEEFKVATYE